MPKDAAGNPAKYGHLRPATIAAKPSAKAGNGKLKPINGVGPAEQAVLETCVIEGLTLAHTINRVEVETGTLLSRNQASLALAAAHAARIDALREAIPHFADNIERTEHYCREVAAVQQLVIRDAELALKFYAELRQWILLQERIRTQQLQSQQQSLTINVNDTDAKDQLTRKLAGLIERSGTGENPGESDTAGSGPAR